MRQYAQSVPANRLGVVAVVPLIGSVAIGHDALWWGFAGFETARRYASQIGAFGYWRLKDCAP